MNMIPIIEQIQSNDKLLSLPQVLSEVLEEVNKEDFSADSLAKIILKDPPLTGRILRLANSSFYNRMTEIKTVNQAVSLLGVTTVKCMALSSSVFHPDKVKAESGVDAKAMFANTLSVASASEKIAKAAGYKAPDEAFIAGLLHDIGILYFVHHHAEEYSGIIGKAIKADTLIEAEKTIFGIDHTEVGSHLAKIWRLPEYVIESIAVHHNSPQNDNNDILQNSVALAVLLTNDSFSGYSMGLEERLRLINEYASILSLSKEQINDVSSSMLAGTIDVAEYLGVDIGNIEEILVTANEEIWKSYLTIENLFKERQELSKLLLIEERAKGAIESKNITMATLSHYLNNAIMIIYGRSQLMHMMQSRGDNDRLIENIPKDLEVINHSINKIVAILEEMKSISPVDKKQFYNVSKALNIDDCIEKRMTTMKKDGSWDMKVETETV